MKTFYCMKCDYFGQTESHQIPGDPHDKICPSRAILTGKGHAALGKLVLDSDGDKMNCIRPRHKPVTTLSHKNKVAKRKLVRMGAEV